MKKDNYIKTEDLFRTLGVRQNSGIDDITKAYQNKLKRLSSADYADEPEYVARKKAELSNAYSLLIGRAPASLMPQRMTKAADETSEYNEERRRLNRIEERRRPGRTEERKQQDRPVKSLYERRSSGNYPKTSPSPQGGNTDTGRTTSAQSRVEQSRSSTIPFGRSKPTPTISTSGTTRTTGRNQTQPFIPALVMVISIAVVVLGTVISDLGLDSEGGNSHEYNHIEEQDSGYVSIDMGDDEPFLMDEDDYGTIVKLLNASDPMFDFGRYIDAEAPDDESKDFDYNITDEDEETIEEYVDSICLGLRFYDQPTIVDALVKKRGYFDEAKPSDKAILFTNLLNAPKPEELNNKVSQFTGEPISDYVSYFRYINDVVDMEAQDVLD